MYGYGKDAYDEGREAFANGADGVFLGGCHIGDCHYISGNEKAYRRVVKTKKMLESVGIDPARFRLEWVSASEGKIFQRVITEFVQELKKLGPSKLRPKMDEPTQVRIIES